MARALCAVILALGLGSQAVHPSGGDNQAGDPGRAGSPGRQPREEDGASALTLSDFEPGERMWTGYDNIGYIELKPGEKAPDGWFHLGSVHPPYQGRWYRIASGHGFAAERVKSGGHSLKWLDTTVSSRIVTAAIPHDWSGYAFLSLWIFSEKANHAAIELVCYSEDLQTPEDDYYKKEIVVNWEGWKLIEVPFDRFTPTRRPLGWDRITYIKIASTGWGHTAQADTVLHLDELKLTDRSIAPNPLENVPVVFPDTPHPYLFGSAGLFEEARKKVARCGWARDAASALKQEGTLLLAETIRVPATGGGYYHDAAQAAEYAVTEEHYRLARAARTLALLARLEGNPAYAAAARDILLQYAAAYRGYELHDRYGNRGPAAGTGGRATAQAINEAKWIIPLAWAYDLTWDGFSPPERERIERDLFREAAAILMANNEGKHNHQAWYNAGVGVIGFLLRDPACVRYAVHGPDNGFLFQMKASLTEEGMWYEGSGHYHFYTMEPLLALSEAAWFAGLDLYGDERYRRYFRFPLLLADPGDGLPLINDGRRVVLTDPDRARLLEIAFARLGDPRLAQVLGKTLRGSLEALLYGPPELPRGAAEQGRSVLLGGSLAVLRSPGGRLYATLNGRPYTGGHSHYDKLSITLFADGRVIAPDSGSIKYEDPAHEGYFLQTVAHNTVVQDGLSQQYGPAAQVPFFAAGPLVQMAWMRDAAAYPGTVQSRALLATDWYLLDLFDLAADRTHRYHWVYRNYGRLEAPPDLRPIAVSAQGLPPGGGFPYLERPAWAPLEGDAGLVWDMYAGEAVTLVPLPGGDRPEGGGSEGDRPAGGGAGSGPGSGGTRLIAADVPVAAPVGDEIDPRRYRAVLLEREAGDTLFASLLVPGRRPGGFRLRRLPVAAASPGGRPAVPGGVPDPGGGSKKTGAFLLSPAAGGPEDLVVYNCGPQRDLEAGGWRTDARVALVRTQDGRPREVFAAGASYLDGPGLALQLGPGYAGIRQPESLLHLSLGEESARICNQQASRVLVRVACPGAEHLEFSSPEGGLQEIARDPGAVTFIADPPAELDGSPSR